MAGVAVIAVFTIWTWLRDGIVIETIPNFFDGVIDPIGIANVWD
jgi:hypothetical protein